MAKKAVAKFAAVRRFVIGPTTISLAIHALALSQIPRCSHQYFDAAPSVSVHEFKIREWIVATPKPLQTPLRRWSQLDQSVVSKIRFTPADEQIVVLAARQGDGRLSTAPHILRVEITPGVVHSHSNMHIRVLTSEETSGVYVRFVIWEIGVPPEGSFYLARSDPDYPGRRGQLFQRDYAVPSIPMLYRGRTYQVEVIATGDNGIASGAWVPIHVL